MQAEDDDVEFERMRSRAERDAEGRANAICLSSDDDEAAPATHPPLVVRSSAASGASSSTGKRPIPPQPVDDDMDIKPDIKRLSLPAPPVFSSNSDSPPVQPTDLEDLRLPPRSRAPSPGAFALGT